MSAFAYDDIMFRCIISAYNTRGVVLIFSRPLSGSIMLCWADFAGGGCGGDGGYGGFAAEPHSAHAT